MVTLIFYPEEKRYINTERLKEELNDMGIQRTDKAMVKEKHIAITFDESQWDNLNDVQQEIIKFVFDFNGEF